MGHNNWQWRGSKGRGGRRNNGYKKRKDKEIKFTTQEQIQKGYYVTYNVVKEAIIANAHKITNSTPILPNLLETELILI